MVSYLLSAYGLSRTPDEYGQERISLFTLLFSQQTKQARKCYKLKQEIKLKLRSFKSSEHIDEKGDGPYRGFDFLSLVSDPLDLAT